MKSPLGLGLFYFHLCRSDFNTIPVKCIILVFFVRLTVYIFRLWRYVFGLIRPLSDWHVLNRLPIVRYRTKNRELSRKRHPSYVLDFALTRIVPSGFPSKFHRIIWQQVDYRGQNFYGHTVGGNFCAHYTLCPTQRRVQYFKIYVTANGRGYNFFLENFKCKL